MLRRGLAAVALGLAAGLAAAQEAAPPAPAGSALRIGARVAPPFAMMGADGRWEGIGIDLLGAVAERLQLRFDLAEVSLEDMIDGVASGRLDGSIAAMSVTAEREKVVDFSNPYFHSGLGMAVAAERRPSLYAVADALRSRAFLATVGTLTVLLFAVGGLAWLAERRRNRKEFEPAPARGLFDGFWWAVVTMTTVGYGDKTPITVPGRLLGVFWMFCAVILTSLVTAQLSAILTAERILSRVTTISDLSRVRVGNVADSASTAALRARGLRHGAAAGLAPPRGDQPAAAGGVGLRPVAGDAALLPRAAGLTRYLHHHFADLSVDKSVRACLPPGRRGRRARQAGAHRLPGDGDAPPPSPSALALRATGSRGPRHWRPAGAIRKCA